MANSSAKRMSISASTRFKVLYRHGFACGYCGAKAPNVELHVDHVEPIVAGGSNSDSNLVAACADCNLGKGSLDLKTGRRVQKNVVSDPEILEAYHCISQGSTWIKEAASLGVRVRTLRDRVLRLGLEPPSAYASDCRIMESYRLVKSGESAWSIEAIRLGVTAHSLKVRVRSMGLNTDTPRERISAGIKKALVIASRFLIGNGESPSLVAEGFGFNPGTFKNLRRKEGLTLTKSECGRRSAASRDRARTKEAT